MERIRIDLSIDEMPRQWYNILPDLAEHLEPLPAPQGNLRILSETMLPDSLAQEFSKDSWIDIPEEVQLAYQRWRPTPLFRARNLEKLLDLPAGIKMYYKAEFYSPTGSHKVNTAVAQAYYAKLVGYKTLVTETGAGQWGSALSFAARLFGRKARVYWVRAVYNWKEARRHLMVLYGAEVFASPSKNTAIGRQLLKKNSKHPGSLGIAISEGLEDVRKHDEAIYCLGSVLNHVLLHQTIIGLEAKKQLEKIDQYPDVIISCLGGGSNFGGLALPFMREVFKNGKKTKFIASQSQGAANLQGEYRYNFADYAGLTPLLKMYTLGHQQEMPPIKADGLRYHAASPIISLLRAKGYIETVAYPVDEKQIFERAKLFIQGQEDLPGEGFLFAPEADYSLNCAIDEALRCQEAGENKLILFNSSGHGFMDMEAYK